MKHIQQISPFKFDDILMIFVKRSNSSGVLSQGYRFGKKVFVFVCVCVCEGEAL